MFRAAKDDLTRHPFPNRVGGIIVSMSLDLIEHERAIYTIFDLLGDIGGLSDILFKLGGILVWIISFLTGSGLDRLLVSSLFKQEK